MRLVSPQQSPKTTGLRAALLTLFILIFVGFSTLAWQDESLLFMPSENLVHILFFSGLSLFLFFATLISMVASTSQVEKSTLIDNTFIICSLSLILAIAELMNLTRSFDPNLFYTCSLVLNCAIVFNLTQASATLLNIPGRWLLYLSFASAGTNLGVGFFMTEDLRLGGYSESLLKLGILTHGILMLLPLGVFILTYMIQSLTHNSHSVRDSLLQRFSIRDDGRELKLTFYALWIVEIFQFSLGLSIYFSEFRSFSAQLGIDPHYPLSQIHFAWLPLILLSINILKSEVSATNQNSNLSGLISNQAKRFLMRYHSHLKTWTTTIGMRTANFMIDHDPNEDTKSVLPSYMVQIRQTQIQSMIRDILQESLMDDRAVANQIFGTIDPENSIRPCTDLLLLFTTTYIEGIPLVESRLKNLVRLLPLLDPELGDRISSETIEKGLGKIQWFFHLDFDWVDQHMVTTSYRTDYQVSIDNLRFRDRQKILSYLQNHNLMGNFIWVGERARERILMEAPYLSNIIEAWPIQIEDQDANIVESVIFLIKFEQLIPRMQKYFNLEETRKKLKYFEPSLESRRMLNLIEIDIQECKSFKEILDILSLINNYPWHGFKEKDLALDLVLKTYEISKSMSDQEPGRDYLSYFVESIQKIGYPSQEIHAAHLDKMQIRQSQTISRTCLNPNHPRFNEAWILLATTPTRQYQEEELIILLGTIDKALRDRQIRKKSIVIKKSTEAFYNICQELTNDHMESIQDVFNSLSHFLIDSRATAEQFCFLLDAKIFLEGNLKEDILVDQEVLNRMQSYFSELYENLHANSSIVMSLSSRWRTLMNQNAAHLKQVSDASNLNAS